MLRSFSLRPYLRHSLNNKYNVAISGKVSFYFNPTPLLFHFYYIIYIIKQIASCFFFSLICLLSLTLYI